jgi:hypothetical protein
MYGKTFEINMLYTKILYKENITMKHLKIIFYTSMLILLLGGCGVKEKLEEKAGEAIAEKMIEDAGGGDVDIDGDKVTIKGENGEEITVGGTQWPESELAKSIPEFKDGEVASVLDSTDSVIITLESVKEEDATSYFEAIKNDFKEESFEATDQESMSYWAKNTEGISVGLQYSVDTLIITVASDAE